MTFTDFKELLGRYDALQKHAFYGTHGTELNPAAAARSCRAEITEHVRDLMKRTGREDIPYSGAELAYFSAWFGLRGGWRDGITDP